ncbi:MAG: NAD(P)-dependent oxidoreductase [Hyphomicrobiaceae bacterium]
MSSNVLIMGASRGIGFATVEAALSAGFIVRAFARSARSIALNHRHLEKFPGDALIGDDVERALDGMDVVIQCLGIPINARMLTGPIDLFSSTTRILIAKMEEAGVKRLITVTGFGAGDGRQRIAPLQRIGFELFLGRAYSDKDIQEQIIKNSSLDWTIVRPGVLTPGEATGNYRVLPEPESWRNGFISRGNVADFLIKQIADSSYISQTPVLIGQCGFPNI